MTEKISNISLSFKCPVNYATMQDVEGGKFCTVCQKTVHDFTSSKADYFRQIMAENGNNVCGRFLPSQMAVQPVRKPLWKKWVSAAMIVLGFNLIAEKVIAQTKTNKQTVSNKSEVICDDNEDTTLGIVFTPQPEFPGGEKKWTAFLVKNLKYIKEASGKRLFASFIVNENGRLSDFKIERGINVQADAEALRVLKLSPKWKPALQNNKPVKTKYTLPISFE